MNYKLKDLLEYSRFGVNTKPSETGDTKFLQLKHFNQQENTLSEVDLFVNLDNSLSRYLLVNGDILFVTKGHRHLAWCYDEKIGQAVASTIFLILHPNTNIIHPQFLELYLNMPEVVSYISDNLVKGSIISSISKEDLMELIIDVPQLQIQQNLIEITNSHRNQLSLIEQLKNTKKHYYNQLMISSIS